MDLLYNSNFTNQTFRTNARHPVCR